jgi:hypothetical protein
VNEVNDRRPTGVKIGLIGRIHSVVKQMSPQPLTTQEVADLLGDDVTENQVRSAIVTYTSRNRKRGQHAIIEYDRSGKMVGWVGLKRGPKPKPAPVPPATSPPTDQAAGQPPLPYPDAPEGGLDDLSQEEYDAWRRSGTGLSYENWIAAKRPVSPPTSSPVNRVRQLAVDDHPAVYEQALGEPSYPDAPTSSEPYGRHGAESYPDAPDDAVLRARWIARQARELHGAEPITPTAPPATTQPRTAEEARVAGRRARSSATSRYPTSRYPKIIKLVGMLDQLSLLVSEASAEIRVLESKAARYDDLKKTLGEL